MGLSPWKSGKSSEPAHGAPAPQATTVHSYEGELMSLACRIERMLAAVEPGRTARHLRGAIEMGREVVGEVSGFAEARHDSAAIVALGAEAKSVHQALDALEKHLTSLSRRDVDGFFDGQVVETTPATRSDYQRVGLLVRELLDGYFQVFTGKFGGEVERERWGQVFRGLGAEILRTW